MESRKEYSYGVIPIHKDDSGNEVLVVHQHSSTGGTFWTLPKGRQESGETNTETALRELKEETGLEVTELIDKSYSVSYTFELQGEVIDKVTTYFPGFIADKTVIKDDVEIIEAKWLSPDEARAILTYDDYKILLDKALKDLDFY